MIDTNNIAVRARECAKCHVGAADRQVNHDLIAAGHPPLKFELAAYQDMLPKHWDDRQERCKKPHFELQLWSVGQLASAEAALRVLQQRASASLMQQDKNRSPQQRIQPAWPELAEYDCFSCHKDLIDPSWRQQRGYHDRRLGMAAWRTWYYSMPARVAMVELSGDAVDAYASQINDLRTLMESQYQTDAIEVAELSGGTLSQLSPFLSQLAETSAGNHAPEEFPVKFSRQRGELAQFINAPDGGTKLVST